MRERERRNVNVRIKEAYKSASEFFFCCLPKWKNFIDFFQKRLPFFSIYLYVECNILCSKLYYWMVLIETLLRNITSNYCKIHWIYNTNYSLLLTNKYNVAVKQNDALLACYSSIIMGYFKVICKLISSSDPSCQRFGRKVRTVCFFQTPHLYPYLRATSFLKNQLFILQNLSRPHIVAVSSTLLEAIYFFPYIWECSYSNIHIPSS